jgi:hypothetical protein
MFLAASIPDVVKSTEAVAVFSHLGYPHYLLPLLGTAKLLGVAALLIPGFAALKEWAYAGLTFDLAGALYSHISTGDGPGQWAFAAVGLVLVLASYLLYRRLRAQAPIQDRYAGRYAK